MQLSHEHSDWGWFDPATYRATHLSAAEVERWGRASTADAFNVLSNRDGLDAFLRWQAQEQRTGTCGGATGVRGPCCQEQHDMRI